MCNVNNIYIYVSYSKQTMNNNIVIMDLACVRQKRYHKPIWFTRNNINRYEARENACFCQLCKQAVYNTSTIQLYNEAGLDLYDGDKIQREVIIKANNIISDHIYAISHIPRLESLAGNYITRTVNILDIRKLPIPQKIRERITGNHYSKIILDFEMNNDTTVVSFYDKSFPNFLWTHGGQYIMMQWNHPT